jgi:hypothetical protein
MGSIGASWQQFLLISVWCLSAFIVLYVLNQICPFISKTVFISTLIATFGRKFLNFEHKWLGRKVLRVDTKINFYFAKNEIITKFKVNSRCYERRNFAKKYILPTVMDNKVSKFLSSSSGFWAISNKKNLLDRFQWLWTELIRSKLSIQYSTCGYHSQGNSVKLDKGQQFWHEHVLSLKYGPVVLKKPKTNACYKGVPAPSTYFDESHSNVLFFL